MKLVFCFFKQTNNCKTYIAFSTNVFSFPHLVHLAQSPFSIFSFSGDNVQVLEWMEKEWRMKTVGPNIPSMYADRQIHDDREYGFNFFKPIDEACRKWLDNRQKASVVFVAFGSFSTLSIEQMEELAWGLAQTNCFFLWVVSFILNLMQIYSVISFIIVF